MQDKWDIRNEALRKYFAHDDMSVLEWSVVSEVLGRYFIRRIGLKWCVFKPNGTTRYCETYPNAVKHVQESLIRDRYGWRWEG